MSKITDKLIDTLQNNPIRNRSDEEREILINNILNEYNLSDEKIEAKKFEIIGRDYTKPIRIFRTCDGEVKETALVIGLTWMHAYNELTKSIYYEFVTNKTYPMYDIDNDYIGYTDIDGVFHNKLDLDKKVIKFVKDNKLPVLFIFTWTVGITMMISVMGTDNFPIIWSGFAIAMLSSLGLSYIKNK